MTRFIHIKTYDNFKQQKLSANDTDTAFTRGPESDIVEYGTPDIPWDSIAFVKDRGVFWTHGKLYDNAEDLSNYVISNNAKLEAGGEAKSIASIFGKDIAASVDNVTSLHVIREYCYQSNIDNFYKEGEVQVALAKNLDNNLLKGGDGIVISIPWINGQGTFGAQIIVDDDSPRIIMRNKIAGNWSEWYSLATVKETTRSEFNSITQVPGVMYLIKD